MESDVADIFTVTVIAVIALTTASKSVVLFLWLDLILFFAVVAVVLLLLQKLLLLGEAFTHLLTPMAAKL